MSKKIISLFLICFLVFYTISPLTEAKAATFKLSESSVTLKVGSHSTLTSQIVPNGMFTNWESSNPEVATVNEYGTVWAHKPGTTVITLWYYDEKAKCTVKVEDSRYLKLEKESITVDTDEIFTVKLKNPKKQYKASRIDVYSTDGDDNVSAKLYSDYNRTNEASIQIYEAGTYCVDIYFWDSDYNTYYASCKVDASWGGLKSKYTAVAVDKTISLPIENSTINSVVVGNPLVTDLHDLAVESRERAIREATELYAAEGEAKVAKEVKKRYEQYFGKENVEDYVTIYRDEDYQQYFENWISSLKLPIEFTPEDYTKGEAVVTKDNKIKGVKPGYVVAKVEYTRNGVSKSAEILINVTNTVCEGISETNLEIGGEYYPEISKNGTLSRVEITSSNPNVVKVINESDYAGKHIRAVASGSAKITVNVDGIKVTKTVKVENKVVPHEIGIGSTIRSEDTVKTDITKTNGNLLTVGQKQSIKPDGIKSGSKVAYTSSNKKVATVSSKGVVTAKKTGSCCITVKVDGKVYKYVSVSVGNSTGITAVRKGETHLGTPYSQDLRMSNGYFDCSSFAWRTYKEAGKYIGGNTSYAPTAAELARYYAENGAVISNGAASAVDLLPGDLVFYSFKGSNGRYKNISHVAVFYGANYEKLTNGKGVHDTGKLIHSVGRGVVFENYERYNTGSIVMICRPSKVK